MTRVTVYVTVDACTPNYTTGFINVAIYKIGEKIVNTCLICREIL